MHWSQCSWLVLSQPVPNAFCSVMHYLRGHGTCARFNCSLATRNLVRGPHKILGGLECAELNGKWKASSHFEYWGRAQTQNIKVAFYTIQQDCQPHQWLEITPLLGYFPEALIPYLQVHSCSQSSLGTFSLLPSNLALFSPPILFP